MTRHQHRVAFVGWVAVTWKDDGDDVTWRRELREARDDGRVDAAAQSDDEPARAARAQLLTHPSRNSFSCRHGEILKQGRKADRQEGRKARDERQEGRRTKAGRHEGRKDKAGRHEGRKDEAARPEGGKAGRRQAWKGGKALSV